MSYGYPKSLSARRPNRKLPSNKGKQNGINKQSPKRKKQVDEYNVIVAQWKKDNPKCACCLTAPTKDNHHLYGKEGERLLDQEFWLPVCRPCHDEIHLNPEWARKEGYLL